MNPILEPLAFGFQIGVSLRRRAYERGWLHRCRLDCPVVSVGNLSVGGTGKTPFVALIAELLLHHGYQPSILTRGYGRRRGAALTLIAPGPGRRPDAREVGDEPALLARKLPSVPIIVAADRRHAGRLAEERWGVNVHLLDDGFQYLALAREVDVVLLDATARPSDGALLPVGRLREPYTSLKWADIIVLTRSDQGDHRSLESKVRKINPGAPLFHSSTRLLKIFNVTNGEEYGAADLRGCRVSAFCGIGNPRAFFTDLRKWGFVVRSEAAFRDHHIFSMSDLERLLACARRDGVAALLTTEKDAVNLPPAREVTIPILACKIEPEIEEAEHFERALLTCLQARRTTP